MTDAEEKAASVVGTAGDETERDDYVPGAKKTVAEARMPARASRPRAPGTRAGTCIAHFGTSFTAPHTAPHTTPATVLTAAVVPRCAILSAHEQ